MQKREIASSGCPVFVVCTYLCLCLAFLPFPINDVPNLQSSVQLVQLPFPVFAESSHRTGPTLKLQRHRSVTLTPRGTVGRPGKKKKKTNEEKK